MGAPNLLLQRMDLGPGGPKFETFPCEFLSIRLRHCFDMLIEVMGHWAAAMQAKDPTKPLSEVAALANDRYSSEAGT